MSEVYPSEPFPVRGAPSGRVAVVDATGDLDLVTVASLDEAVRVACCLATETVLVDLDAVGYIDSSTLGALVRGRKQAQATGKDFYVVRPGALAQRVLSLTGLLDVLQAPAGVTDGPDVRTLLQG